MSRVEKPKIMFVQAGCGLLCTCWLANPLTGLALLGRTRPIKKYPNFPKKYRKNTINFNTSFPVFQQLRKRCRKRRRKMYPKRSYLEFFQNCTPLGGQPKKVL